MNSETAQFGQNLYLHGTKAKLEIGDLLHPLYKSNYQDRIMNHIYFTGTLEAAKWGAELYLRIGQKSIFMLLNHWENLKTIRTSQIKNYLAIQRFLIALLNH